MIHSRGMLSSFVRKIYNRPIIQSGTKFLSTYASREPCCSHSSGTFEGKFIPQIFQNANGQLLNYNLPSSIRSSLVYTFPTVESALPKLAPTSYLDVAKLDPLPFVDFIKAPEYNHQLPVVEKLAVRMIVIRHRKIKKHKRKKYRKRDKFLWAKKQRNKKSRAEKEFRQRCSAMLVEAVNFSAEKYVADFLEKYAQLIAACTNYHLLISSIAGVSGNQVKK